MRWDQAGLGAAATISLGVPFLLIEVAQRSFSTTAMAASRVTLAALALGVLMLWSQRARRDARDLLTTRPLTAAFVALTAALVPNLMIGAGEHHVSTGATAVLLALTPVWIAIGTTFLDVGERVEVRQAAALVAAVVGVGLVCSAAAPQGAWGWYALPLLASISYAISALVVRRTLPAFHPLAVTAVEMGLAAIPLIVAVAVAPGTAVAEGGPSLTAVVAVVVAGIGCSGIGWMANTALVQRAGPVRASVVSYTSVLVSVALGAAVLGEPLTPRIIMGTIVLIISVWALLAPRRKQERTMLELSILGFLAEEPFHAYELRRRISSLSGHARPVSDGALTPALRRMERAGLVVATREPGAGGPSRKVFRLTDAGREELIRRLVHPEDIDITNDSRFFTLLAFLDHLQNPQQQQAVLQRRLAFLEEPGRGFFINGGESTSRFRRGMTAMARDISQVERRWLRETINGVSG